MFLITYPQGSGTGTQSGTSLGVPGILEVLSMDCLLDSGKLLSVARMDAFVHFVCLVLIVFRGYFSTLGI